MSLVIRLMRVGKKGESKYRLVVKEKRDRRDGKAVEMLGSFEKRVGGKQIKKINTDRVNYWVANGAQLSSTAKKILEA